MSLTSSPQSILLSHSFLLALQASINESMASATHNLQEAILDSVNRSIDNKLSVQMEETLSAAMGVGKRPKRTRPSKRLTVSQDSPGRPSKSRGNTTNCLHVSHHLRLR
jgi:hypothetical protein